MSDSILQSAPTSRLMQNYREEVPATALGALVSCTDSSGTIHLFTLGSGNHVYCIRQDAASSTGWAAPIDTGIVGPVFAACPFGDGMVVFGAAPPSLFASVCSTPGGTFEVRALAFDMVTPIAMKAWPNEGQPALFYTFNVGSDPAGPCKTYIAIFDANLEELDIYCPPGNQDAASFDLITMGDGSTAVSGIVTPTIYAAASGQPHQVWTSKRADNDFPVDASLWRTLPSDGYLALGDFVLPGSNFDTPSSAAAMVQAVTDPAGVLPPPIIPTPVESWYRFWDDTNSYARDDVTVWRASDYTAPDGTQYVALGDAVVGNHKDDDPPSNYTSYALVSTVFVTPGIISDPCSGCTKEPAELCNQNMRYLIENDRGVVPAAFDEVTAESGGIGGRTFFVHTNDLGLPTDVRYTLASAPIRPSSVSYWSSPDAYGRTTPTSAGAPSPSAVVSYAWAPNAQGASQLFAVLQDGHLYTLEGGSWTTLDGAGSYLAVTAAAGTSGPEVFALGTNRQLYHLRSTSEGWSEPLQIAATSSIGTIASLRDANGAAVCFAITADQQVLRIEQDPTTGDWSVAPIELEATGTIAELYTWSVEIAARDDDGNILAQQPVKVWADGAVEVMINGTGAILDPDLPATVNTNASGILTITSVATTITSPTIYFQTQSMEADSSVVEVQPNAAMQSTLASATASDYETRLGLDESTATSVAAAVQQVMSFDTGGDATPTLVRSPVGRPRQVPGVRRLRRGEEAASRRVRWPEEARFAWELDFTKETPTFRTLTAADLAAFDAERARLPKAFGFLSWLSDLGDLIAGLIDGVVKVAKCVVSWVGDQLQAAWTIIVNGVTYVFDAIVETITDAFNVVSAFFAQVGAAFAKVVEWLGFLFDWGDILRTAAAIEYVLSGVIGGVLTGGLPQLQTKVDGWFSAAQSQLATLLQDAQNAIGRNGSLSTGADSLVPTPPPALDAVAGTNIVLDGTMNNIAGASVDTTSPRAQRRLAACAKVRARRTADTDPVLQLASYLQSSPAYANTSSAVDSTTDGGNTDGALASPLGSLLSTLQDLATTALEYAQSAFDDAFSTVSSGADSLFGEDGLLSMELDIPYVSALYTYLTGQPTLTIGGLISLILAIPTTIVYKLAANAAPFPDDAAITSFKSAITADGILAATGLAASASSGLVLGAIDPVIAKFFGTFNGVAMLLLGVAEAAADLIPLNVDSTWEPIVSMLSLMVLLLEWLAFFSSCTYLQGASTFSWSCDAEGISNITWAMGVAGPVFDSVAFWSTSSDAKLGLIMRDASDAWIALDVALSLPGLISTVLAGVVSKNGWQVVQGVVLHVAQLFHVLRVESHEFNTVQTWLPAAVDGVASVVAAAIQFGLTWSSSEVALPPPTLARAIEA
jgi:Flp pilus assembly pilin Flp